MPLKPEKQDIDVLIKWWEWLDGNRGQRARLKRANSPDEVVAQSAFFQFLSFRANLGSDRYKQLTSQWRQPDNAYAAALVCGLLARVKSNSKQTFKQELFNDDKVTIDKEEKTLKFAEQLAMPNKGGSSPIMSEIRFLRLQKSRNSEEFYLQVSRAIALLGGSVNIESMVENLLQWLKEHELGLDKKPNKRLCVRWATEYYTILNRYSKAANS